MAKKRCLSLAFSLLALASVQAVSAALAQGAGGERPISATTTGDWSVQVVTDDLSYPWDINGVGNLLMITEAAGNIVMIEDGRLNRHAVKTSDAIVHDGGSGLLGMALSENFETSGLAYLYHSYRSGSGLANKVIEARFNGQSWQETRVLLAGIPGHRLYNGGRIAIGPDGHLYVTTGWTENGRVSEAMDLRSGRESGSA
jgi:glucose/arabinose dehydrogenase